MRQVRLAGEPITRSPTAASEPGSGTAPLWGPQGLHPPDGPCELREGSSAKPWGVSLPVNTGPTQLLLRRYSMMGPGEKWGGCLGVRLSIPDDGMWMSCSWSDGSVRPRVLGMGWYRDNTPETQGRTQTSDMGWKRSTASLPKHTEELLRANIVLSALHIPSHFIFATTL